MRQLLHTFAGGWTPLWLGASLKAWWDPESGITKSGSDRVSAWADRVGAVSLVQSTGANQFLWQAAASEMNGRQSLYGDGSRLMWIVTAPVGLRVTQQAHTILAVTRAAGDQIGTGATSAGNVLIMRFPLTGSPKVRAHVWATGALTTVDGLTTVQPTTRALIGQMATGAPGSGTLSPILNGVVDNTPPSIGGTAATPSTSFILGARGFGIGGDTFNGYLGDVFIIDRALTTLELAEFARWAKNRWGI